MTDRHTGNKTDLACNISTEMVRGGDDEIPVSPSPGLRGNCATWLLHDLNARREGAAADRRGHVVRALVHERTLTAATTTTTTTATTAAATNATADLRPGNSGHASRAERLDNRLQALEATAPTTTAAAASTAATCAALTRALHPAAAATAATATSTTSTTTTTTTTTKATSAEPLHLFALQQSSDAAHVRRIHACADERVSDDVGALHRGDAVTPLGR